MDKIINQIFDKDFLQSEEWRKFQESVGRKTYAITEDNFNVSIIEHQLPMVGKYFYIPRGPIVNDQRSMIKDQLEDLISLAKNNGAGWIRIEPTREEILALIKKNIRPKIVKAPHDMQPKEVFIIDITKSEEQLLSEMKAKTRYNIRLAEKKGVIIKKTQQTTDDKGIREFCRLTKVMAKRQGITAHPESYYRKMLEVIPSDLIKLYIAEYQGKVIAANIVVFHEGICTYLHGASDDNYRNVMAPYLLQWSQIKDAKAAGCKKYDFGGIKTSNKQKDVSHKRNDWAGITRFKLGFSPMTKPIVFPGCYDILINSRKYFLYQLISKIKKIF